MKPFSILVVFLLLINCTSTSKTSDTPALVNRGNRMLGYDILDMTEIGTFNDNLIKAQSMGLNFITIHLPWNAIDITTNATNTLVDPANTFALLNSVATANNLKLAIIISPIDIPGRNFPSDISTLKFTNQILSARFNALVDFLFNPVNGIVDPLIVTSLSVGNEIDAYDWSGNGDTQMEYISFLSNIKTVINAYGVKLNFTVTYSGLISGGTMYADMAAHVDAVSVTYYPQNSVFQVYNPDVPQADLNTLITRLPEKEIHLQEVGYQTSGSSGSSETMQADFFYNFFKAWDEHATTITHVSILRFNDSSMLNAQTTATNYGLPNNTNFIEYIRTLGLRTWAGTGTDKEAMGVIQNAVLIRGW